MNTCRCLQRFVSWLRDCSRVESRLHKHSWPLVNSLIQLFYIWVTLTTWLLQTALNQPPQSSVKQGRVILGWAYASPHFCTYVHPRAYLPTEGGERVCKSCTNIATWMSPKFKHGSTFLMLVMAVHGKTGCSQPWMCMNVWFANGCTCKLSIHKHHVGKKKRRNQL